MMKKSLPVIFAAVFFVSGCASAPVNSKASSSETSLILAPDVKEEMLLSDYWISRVRNPYKVKMPLSKIALWNEKASGSDYRQTILCDLRKVDSVMTAQEIRSQMHHYNPKVKWFKKIQEKSGEKNSKTTESAEKIVELTEKDWKVFYDEMNFSALGTFSDFTVGKKRFSENKKDFTVRKALCVRRSNLRLIPEDAFYSDDEEFWFDDAAQNSGILMNEPLLVLFESRDKNWFFVRTGYCTGWIHREDVAFCTDSEFSELFDWASKADAAAKRGVSAPFVTVTADRYAVPDEYLVPSADSAFFEKTDLFMGTYLMTADWTEEILEHFTPRVPGASHLVKIPCRRADESLGFVLAALPAGYACTGLLPYTTAGVLKLAFQSLGIRYGWGGMAEARDCSEYLLEIFRCFGFSFPRNSRGQMEVPGKTVVFEGKSRSSRKRALDSVDAGSVLGFPGHVFMYLGKESGRHFVISALGSYYPDENFEEKTDACSVSINTVNVMRKNGRDWLENLTCAKMLVLDSSEDSDYVALDPDSRFASFSKIHDGKALLYRASEKRKNRTVAVNAGHGCSGGTSEKTFSHPDRSPKVTGGTNPEGAVESFAISGGMEFSDGKKEAEVNLRVAHLLRDRLLKDGYDVLMLRDSYDARLDNIARTVISNSNADVHIALHFDGDDQTEDKGVFYCGVPDEIKRLSNVKKHWKESERLGQSLIEGMSEKGFKIHENGRMAVDLTQTSFSTIPTVDIELGNQCSDTSTVRLEKMASALLLGINKFFVK